MTIGRRASGEILDRAPRTRGEIIGLFKTQGIQRNGPWVPAARGIEARYC